MEWNTVPLSHNIHIKHQKADRKEKISIISKILFLLMIFSMKMLKNKIIDIFWKGSGNIHMDLFLWDCFQN